MRVFAHRGWHRGEPENSLGAFAAARELGADGIELDVRRSADGVLVVHHDASVGAREIARTPYEELVGASRRPLATLDEALGASGTLVVNVEVKLDASARDAERVSDLVASVAQCVRAKARGPVIASSFDLATCRAWREVAPEIAVGWLLGHQSVPEARRHVEGWGLAALHPPIRSLRASDVADAHEHSLALNVWTVNRRRDLSRCLEWGVDAVITDRADRALALARRAKSYRSVMP